jgi:hypothetical protein
MTNYSVGDGMVAIALAGGIVGYLWLKNKSKLEKMAMIHQERMTAMEKGIPLPELPLEPVEDSRTPDQRVIPLLGVVLLTLSLGTMVVLYLSSNGGHFWIAPLPFAFLGAGLIGYQVLMAVAAGDR